MSAIKWAVILILAMLGSASSGVILGSTFHSKITHKDLILDKELTKVTENKSSVLPVVKEKPVQKSNNTVSENKSSPTFGYSSGTR
jgi:hypothetical protein